MVNWVYGFYVICQGMRLVTLIMFFQMHCKWHVTANPISGHEWSLHFSHLRKKKHVDVSGGGGWMRWGCNSKIKVHGFLFPYGGSGVVTVTLRYDSTFGCN